MLHFKQIATCFGSIILMGAMFVVPVHAQEQNSFDPQIGTVTLSDKFQLKANRNAAKTVTEFYNQLYNNLLGRKTTFTITYNGKYTDIYNSKVSISDMFERVFAVDKPTSDDYDYLKYNVASYQFVYSYTAKQAVFRFQITYRESKAQTAKVNTKVASVLKSLNLTGLSDAEKALKIHDYIVNHMDYDQTFTKYTAFWGLIDTRKQTVCQGYALLSYKMFTEAGMKARLTTGYANGAHAWNIVRIDGNWYQFDATWDDPISEKPMLLHNYFLIGTKTLSKDHKLDKKYTTQYTLSSTDYDWKAEQNSAIKDVTDETMEMRLEFQEELNKQFDKELNYSKSSPMEQKLWDIYKRIILAVIGQIPDNTFYEMIEDDGKSSSALLDLADSQIRGKIVNPLLTYIDSNKLEKEVINEITKLIEKYPMNGLTEKQQDAVIEQWVNDIMNEKICTKLDSLSKANSQVIINTLIQSVS